MGLTDSTYPTKILLKGGSNFYLSLSLYNYEDATTRRLSETHPNFQPLVPPSSHCLVMARKRQGPHLKGGPGGELLEAQLHTGNKRTNSEAFGAVDQSSESVASSKKLHEDSDIEKLGEFADSVLLKIACCGEQYSSLQEMPQLPGLMPQTETALNACQTIINTALSLIKKSKYQDNDTYGLIGSVNKSQFTEDPQVQRISLIGASGVGRLEMKREVAKVNNLRQKFVYELST